jgi:hypothetical protein
MISNISAGNSTLDYSIELTNNTFPGDVAARIIPVKTETANVESKDNPVVNKGMSVRGSGGPDNFGYEWIDSNDPQGPVYEWNDISTTGTEVTGWVSTGSFDPLDEGKAGPIPLGMNFKFYGEIKTQLYISSNGFISFNDITEDTYTNDNIPTAGVPDNYIAPFWDDLEGSSGQVYYQQVGNKFIIQFNNWGFYSGSGSLTYQVVLQSNNQVYFYYNNMSGSMNSSTVGIENGNGTDGLQIAYNATYVQNDLAVKISAEPDWLVTNNFEGTVYNGNSFAVVLDFLTTGLELGQYSMDVVISSNDPVNQQVTVPVVMHLDVTPVELTSFTAENNSGNVLLKWNTATETNNKGFEVERHADSKQSAAGNWAKIGFVNGNGTTTDPKLYSFKDENPENGNIQYRLKQIDLDGSVQYYDKIEIEVSNIPVEFALSQNYPNPFNPTTTIRYDIPDQSEVTLNIYDGLGRLVKSLVNEVKEPGKFTVIWNGRNNENGIVASGFYICKIKAGSFTSIKKMLLLK